MPPRLAPANLLTWIDRYWKALLPASAGLMATIGTFWSPPPEALAGDGKTYVSFVRFVVAVLLGVMILPMVKWARRRYARRWGGIAAAALACGVAAFFGYQMLLMEQTVNHHGNQIVVGSELTKWAKKFVEANPGEATDAALLENAAGDPTRIWTERSIRRNRLLLSSAYVLFAPFFAITMIAVAQIAMCAGTQRRRRRGARRRAAVDALPDEETSEPISREAVGKKPPAAA